MGIRRINPMSSLCELLHNMYKNIMDEVMNKIHFLNKNILRFAQNTSFIYFHMILNIILINILGN